MGGATRFLMLLTSHHPFVLLPPLPSSLLFRLVRNSRQLTSHLPLAAKPYSTSRPPIPSPSPIHCNSYHSHPVDDFRDEGFASNSGPAPSWGQSHPWPEWSRFVDLVNQAGYFEHVDYGGADANAWGFVSVERLSVSSPEFFRAARACLEFARDRDDLLGFVSKNDVSVVVENGSAYLFGDAELLRSRLRSFLGFAGSNDVELGRATMVDLMKILLSYASNPSVSSAGNYHANDQVIGLSVQNLLRELANVSIGSQSFDFPRPMENQFSERYGQTSSLRGQHIEMKRGDWVCPKCTFMNFAKNMKCLECDEARPKRQLTGREWECPQCDFHNYGRNITCLRCDCKRPGEVTVFPAGVQSESGRNSSYEGGMGSRLANNEEKAQKWFNDLSQTNNSDTNQGNADKDFPEIMPLRKGVNRFVVSTRKTPLERRLTDAQSQGNLRGDFTEGMQKSSNSKHVPFVPLPADMFATKPQEKVKELRQDHGPQTLQGSTAPDYAFRTESSDAASQTLELPKKPVSLTESEDISKEQVEKSEQWFKRVAELPNVSNLASEIPDEDFPEIMPMRKGENRFVVSKKKDHSLTSPMQKRRAAMEQASESKFVPFVPFPPDYFAKKDKPHTDGIVSSQNTTSETQYNLTGQDQRTRETYQQPLVTSQSQQINNMQYNRGTWGSASSEGNPIYRNYNNGSQTSPNSGSITQESYNNSWNMRNDGPNSSSADPGIRSTSYGNSIQSDEGTDNINSGHNWGSRNLSNEGTQNSDNGSSEKSVKTSWDSPREKVAGRDGWTGKSLEGSAVKEPDPLDMSEEAKAERWFRRAAQIKDISELSQIPDEDFPSIMPMRKGVNRFVVSKRKTPLERRLASSPQYRRNLPTVNLNPPKKEDENN